MSNGPTNYSFTATFLKGAIRVLVGAVALLLAVTILGMVAPFLIGAVVLASVVLFVRAIRRARSNSTW